MCIRDSAEGVVNRHGGLDKSVVLLFGQLINLNIAGLNIGQIFAVVLLEPVITEALILQNGVFNQCAGGLIQTVPPLLAGADNIMELGVAGDDHIVLHFIQLSAGDREERILLSINSFLLQCVIELRDIDSNRHSIP